MTLGKALALTAMISLALFGVSAWMFGDDSRGPAWLFFIVGLLGWVVFLLATIVDIAARADRPVIHESQ